MVQNVIKWAIAGSLLSGAIIALFVFIGNLIANLVLSKNIKKISLDPRAILIIVFVISMLLIIFISMKILLNPTDLHILGDLFR